MNLFERYYIGLYRFLLSGWICKIGDFIETMTSLLLYSLTNLVLALTCFILKKEGVSTDFICIIHYLYCPLTPYIGAFFLIMGWILGYVYRKKLNKLANTAIGGFTEVKYPKKLFYGIRSLLFLIFCCSSTFISMIILFEVSKP